VLRKLAVLPVALPDLDALRAYSHLGNSLFWARCFGCAAPPAARARRLAATGGTSGARRARAPEQADSDLSEDEVVTVHQFARQVMSDYASS
jgi:hypothetical protein